MKTVVEGEGGLEFMLFAYLVIILTLHICIMQYVYIYIYKTSIIYLVTTVL